MTPEEHQRAIHAAAASTPAVNVTGFSVVVPSDSGMIRLSGVEQLGSDAPVHGRGAWLMTPQKAAELHNLLGQIMDALKRSPQ